MYRIMLIVVAISLVGLTVLPARSAGQDEGKARKLINAQGCKACHALEGDGGTVAMSFETIRASSSRAGIREQLVNPSQKHGKGTIPDFGHLSAAEIDALVNFIVTKP